MLDTWAWEALTNSLCNKKGPIWIKADGRICIKTVGSEFGRTVYIVAIYSVGYFFSSCLKTSLFTLKVFPYYLIHKKALLSSMKMSYYYDSQGGALCMAICIRERNLFIVFENINPPDELSIFILLIFIKIEASREFLSPV